jgi:hypothetical protein
MSQVANTRVAQAPPVTCHKSKDPGRGVVCHGSVRIGISSRLHAESHACHGSNFTLSTFIKQPHILALHGNLHPLPHCAPHTSNVAHKPTYYHTTTAWPHAYPLRLVHFLECASDSYASVL